MDLGNNSTAPLDQLLEIEDSLETVPDDHDETTNKRLDDNALVVLRRTLPSFNAIALLLMIVKGSEGLLDPKYGEIEPVLNLLEQHPKLNGVLEEAWATRNTNGFRTIRNLSAEFICSLHYLCLTCDADAEILRAKDLTGAIWGVPVKQSKLVVSPDPTAHIYIPNNFKRMVCSTSVTIFIQLAHHGV
jgi:hypothetical protein